MTKDASWKVLDGFTRGPATFELSQLIAAPLLHQTILVCATDDEAEKWYDDLEFFSKFRKNDWGSCKLRLLPSWGQSPYRNFQPSPTQRAQRLRVFHELLHQAEGLLVVTSIRALVQVAPDIELFKKTIQFQIGQQLNPEDFVNQLRLLGYQEGSSVEDIGYFSVRGGIVDVFSAVFEHPIRVEFADDSVESVRLFNPETQRSIRSLSDSEKVSVIPVRDFFCGLEKLQSYREKLKDWCDSKDLPKVARERISSLLNQGIAVSEMDYLAGLFRNKNCTILDYLQKKTQLVVVEKNFCDESAAAFYEKEVGLFGTSLEKQNIIPDPEYLYQDYSQLIHNKLWIEKYQISALASDSDNLKSEPIILAHKKGTADILQVANRCKSLNELGMSVVLVANSQAQLDRITFLLSHQKIRTIPIKNLEEIPGHNGIVAITNGAISESFYLYKKLAFISEDEIFGKKMHQKSSKKSSIPPVVVNDLSVGDLVVHADHGIGKYLGLQKVNALQSEGDFMLLEYADGDKLYVPVYRLESLNRYVSAPGATGIVDKLGTGTFAKTKEKVKSAVKEIAQDLLRVSAERELKEGHAFASPDDDFRSFEAEFPFDETPDQAKAIQDTIDDMCMPKPMDRLVCGDVGFGKTEVAIRAAFKAAQDGKQVAVLVPTTILAEQHHQTFSQRMSSSPIKLASISRFRSSKEQDQILKDLESGKLDILIGTHRLLSKDVKFKDLGLLIIDEEQRFGVEHKEKLKQIKATTDVLTLSATPIPRTLQMSLMGLKDVSIIRTPPGDRLSIKTYLSSFDQEIIKTAIENELSRGGQVFFIHNRIHDIHKIEELIRKLVPAAKPVVAHGQMPEGTLEKAMLGFYQKKFDVLIATAIIENGLDVPNANTLIVNRADTFGLSQLYQIRGRVGRSQTRAFAYFLVPESGIISGEAQERLAVLQRFVELGSGYSIATHDLEIRGGGDILGQQQSGHIAAVGYDMYLDLLQEEIQRLKGQKVAKRNLEEVEINLPFTALLPQEYIPDMKTRITLYRKLSAIENEEAAEEARRELEDRYGPIPKEANELLWVLRLKILMRRMGLKSITVGPKGLSIAAGQNPILEPVMILALVQANPQLYGLHPDGKLIIKGNFRSAQETHTATRQILQTATQ